MARAVTLPAKFRTVVIDSKIELIQLDLKLEPVSKEAIEEVWLPKSERTSRSK